MSTSPILLQLYCSFINPHLEYASIVWSLHLLKHKTTLEKVQYFALKVCLKDWSIEYFGEGLDATHLPSLETHRDHTGFMFSVQHCAPQRGLWQYICSTQTSLLLYLI